MSPLWTAVFVCFAAVVAEGLFAGGGVREHLKSVRLPRGSPPFWLWVMIGIAYYAIFFTILLRLLSMPPSAWRTFALVLALVVLGANAVWNYFFFRKKDRKASLFFSIAYSAVAVVLILLLLRIDVTAASLLAVYGIYLIFANRWQYEMWRANQ